MTETLFAYENGISSEEQEEILPIIDDNAAAVTIAIF